MDRPSRRGQATALRLLSQVDKHNLNLRTTPEIEKNVIGIAISKKIGKAVQRNRARRVIMAAYREIYPQINEGYDFIFVARGKTPFLKSTDVLRCMEKQLKKAGVLK